MERKGIEWRGKKKKQENFCDAYRPQNDVRPPNFYTVHKSPLVVYARRFIRNNIDKSFSFFFSSFFFFSFFAPIAMMKVSKQKDLFDGG